MFAMLEPTTFPTAMSPLPRSDARLLTTSSGADVPNATTVSPATTGVTPKRVARRTAPPTSHSAP